MVVDVLAEAGGRPNAFALITPGGAWTYAELGRAVEERSRMLGNDDVDPGRVVPLLAGVDVPGVVELLALWRRGAIPVPLNPKLTDFELDVARRQLAAAPVPDGTQVILWTSGTSGGARGVALSFDNLVASTRAAADRLALGRSDVWLASLAMAHVGGLVLVVRSLLLGGTLIAAGPFRAKLASDLLDGKGLPAGVDTQLTHMSLVPTQLLRILDYREGLAPPRSFRCALIGGAHTPASLVARAIRSDWPLALTYGTTEMTSQIATASPATTVQKPGTVGRPLSGVEVEIGDEGEISARGQTRAIGYVGERCGELSDAGGWCLTGDLGRLDEDGDLWITGRRIDRIVSGGVTVHAVEVEEAIRSHPTVRDACVVGVHDEEWGEKVGAWIQPEVGEFELPAVQQHVRERVAAAKIPRVWHVEQQIPRNVNGKVDRAKVRGSLVTKGA